jgi:hypothetical protein
VLSACVSATSAATHEHLRQKLAHYAPFFAKISSTQLPHEIRWLLLSACGPARWNYWARTHQPDEGTISCHAAFDAMVLAAFKTIAGIEGDLSLLIAHLPLRDSGLGLQRFEFIGPIAYAASTETDPDQPDQQTRTEEFNRKNVITALSPSAARHLESTRRRFASLWLKPPAPSRLGYAYGFALQHRVRFFGSKSSTQRCDGCHVELKHDQFDGHTLGCARRKGPAPTQRSARVVAAIANTLRDNGVDVATECSITPHLRMDIVVYTPRVESSSG